MDNYNNIYFWHLIADAAQNLWLSKQRSLLALLGILIGSASVVTMLSIGSMAEHQVLNEFEKMGVNMFVIQRGATALGRSMAAESQGLDLDTVSTLPASVSKVIRISPLRTDTVRISTRTGEQDLDLAAVWPAIQDISGLQIKNGRFLAPIDQGNLVAVLGSTAADKLAAAGRPISLGSTIPLGRYLFTIVGIMQEAPENHFTPIDFNKAIIIPLGVSDRVLGHAAPNSAMGLMMAGSDPASVSAAIVAVFARANPDGPVRVQGARELIQALRAQRAIQNRMFVALAGVSLLVGGIGVMNVMFMSVMERRREIGLRAAVGASPRVIQLAFLIEAGILSGLGGFGGSLIGVILSIAVALHSGWTFQVPLYAVPIGVGLAIVAGMIFGVVPALKASRLNPMEALRAE